jgi:hypothetical protein
MGSDATVMGGSLPRSYAPVAIGLHPFLQQPEPVQNSLFGMISQE